MQLVSLNGNFAWNITGGVGSSGGFNNNSTSPTVAANDENVDESDNDIDDNSYDDDDNAAEIDSIDDTISSDNNDDGDDTFTYSDDDDDDDGDTFSDDDSISNGHAQRRALMSLRAKPSRSRPYTARDQKLLGTRPNRLRTDTRRLAGELPPQFVEESDTAKEEEEEERKTNEEAASDMESMETPSPTLLAGDGEGAAATTGEDDADDRRPLEVTLKVRLLNCLGVGAPHVGSESKAS